MRYAVPVEDLLFLLCANTILLVEEIQEWTLGLFQCRIGTRFQISQVGENTFLKLLGVLHRATKGLETE